MEGFYSMFKIRYDNISSLNNLTYTYTGNQLKKVDNSWSPTLRYGSEAINDRTYSARLYMKAFNHKIIPIFLTIISTVLGLISFVWSGQNEVFWVGFAVGAMG